MNYEFKYEKSKLNLISSIVFGILSLKNFGLLILTGSTPYNLLLMIATVATAAMAMMHLKMYLGHRVYLSINDTLLYKDQGLIRSKKRIYLKNIKYIKTIGSQIRIGVEQEDELRVNLNCLNVEDIAKLECIFDNISN